MGFAAGFAGLSFFEVAFEGFYVFFVAASAFAVDGDF